MKAFALLAWEPAFEPPNVSGNWETPTSDYCPTVYCAPRAPLPHIECIHTKWFCKRILSRSPRIMMFQSLKVSCPAGSLLAQPNSHTASSSAQRQTARAVGLAGFASHMSTTCKPLRNVLKIQREASLRTSPGSFFRPPPHLHYLQIQVHL